VTIEPKRIGEVVNHGHWFARRLTYIRCEEQVARSTTLIVNGIHTELTKQLRASGGAIDTPLKAGHFTQNGLSLVVFLSDPANKGDIVCRMPTPQEAAAQLAAQAEKTRRAEAEAAKKVEAEAAKKTREETERRRRVEEERRREAAVIETQRAKLKSLAAEGIGLEQKLAYADISAAEYTARKNRIGQEIDATKNRLAELEGRPADVPVATPAATPVSEPAASDDNLRLIKQRFMGGEIDRAEYESLIALNEATTAATTKPGEGSPDELMVEFENMLESGAISEEKFEELKAKYKASRST
jgi:hypothetical protein